MPGERDPEFMTLLEEASGNNSEALACMVLFTSYCHEFDDIVDKDTELTARNMVRCNNLLARLLTCKFFVENRAILLAQILLIGESYAASEEYRNSGFEKKREWSLYMRHCGNDFIRAVALIVGGEAGLIYTSKRLREFSLKDHYDKDNKPI